LNKSLNPKKAKETHMKKNLIMILVGSIVAFAVVGCSAPAEGNTEGGTANTVDAANVKPMEKGGATNAAETPAPESK
jgi:hypothetical protein